VRESEFFETMSEATRVGKAALAKLRATKPLDACSQLFKSITAMPRSGRYRVESGHCATIANRSLLTHHDFSAGSFAVVHNCFY
jgi:hypothetical protein